MMAYKANIAQHCPLNFNAAKYRARPSGERVQGCRVTAIRGTWPRRNRLHYVGEARQAMP